MQDSVGSDPPPTNKKRKKKQYNMKNLKDIVTESFVSEAFKIMNVTNNDMFADQLSEFIWSRPNAEYNKIRRAMDNDSVLSDSGFGVLWERAYLELILDCGQPVNNSCELTFIYDHYKHDYFCQTPSKIKFGPITTDIINFLARQVKLFIKSIPGDTLYVPEKFVIRVDLNGEAEYR